MEFEKPKRLGSLDVLRGFDLFALVFFQPVFSAFARVTEIGWVDAVNTQFNHVQWEGFAFWDLIMPLFMFMAGASMPFAFGKYLSSGGKTELYNRVLKRVALLWIFGMIAQGNLLALDPEHIYLFSNTLQAIAIGYLISAILLIHFDLRWQAGITSGLLLVYWALLSFVRIDGYGGGDFSPDYNLAEYIDRIVLGRFRDGSQMLGTEIDFGNYRYTWVLSSLNFGVTVMTGVFAGHMMKSRLTKIKKIQWMAITGVLMIVAGQLWGLQMPIIKKIWTSSMTLYSSGLFHSCSQGDEDYSAYLFAYFVGNGPGQEAVHFAISPDGFNWVALNGNQPVIAPDTISSRGGVRDPHILRGPDGKFYMVLTDLYVPDDGWTNTGMVFLKSDDLVSWTSSKVNIPDLFSEFNDVTRVWAPQTFYDEEAGKYMVYFSMLQPGGYDIIYYAYANDDFTSLATKPEQLFYHPDSKSCIDGDIFIKTASITCFSKPKDMAMASKKLHQTD
jgi:predicted acyltransferase